MTVKVPKIRLIPGLFKLRTSRTIIALILRELATSYGRSPGGYIWAFAEPIAGIALLTFIFSLGFQAPPIGSSFALFYASGLVPFLIYADISSKISQSINFSLPLLGYPSVTLADAVIARALLSIATQMIVSGLVFGGLLMLFETQSSVDFARLAQAHLMAFSLGVGVGVMNCFLVTLFPVWQRIWGIANRPMFLLSCIVFLFEFVPDPYQDWLWYNPIIHIVGMARHALYFGYTATYVTPIYVYFLSLGLCVIGFFLIWLFKDRLLNR